MPEDLVLRARWVLPISAPPIDDGTVVVRGGKIAACGPAAEVAGDGSAATLDLGECAVLPGLINAHAHLELTALRGFLEERDFFVWIRKLTDTKYGRLDAEDLLGSARWGVVEALRAGITTVGEVCDLGVSMRALKEGGARAVVYQEVFGPAPEVAADSLRQLEDKVAAHRSQATSRLTVGVSPHAPYTVSAPLFEAVTELALRERLPVSIHAAESAAESEFVRRGKGPFAAFLERRGIAWKAPECSTIEYLERLGALRARPLLVHCVDVSSRDVEMIAASGSSIAHCPKSNAKLGHGIAPLSAWLDAGLAVGLGSDGVVSNNTCDVLEEARVAALVDRARTGPRRRQLVAADFLRQMTLGGADALGLADRVGSLEVGKQADLTAVDLGGAHAQPVNDVESALVWSSSARDVVLTMVDGEILYREGRVRTLDEERARAAVREVARKLARSRA